jgi:hypothetical protein
MMMTKRMKEIFLLKDLKDTLNSSFLTTDESEGGEGGLFS